MTNEEVIAAFKAGYPNCFKAIEDVVNITKSPPEKVNVILATVLTQHTPAELAKWERAFVMIGSERAQEILQTVDKQHGRPRYDLSV